MLNSTCIYVAFRLPGKIAERAEFPSAAPVGTTTVVRFQHWIDHRPSGLGRILAGEKSAIAGHRVGQKPLVGRFLSGLVFEKIELSLLTDKFFSGKLDASGEGDGGTGQSRKRR
jgi:hypothetical protein